MTAEIGGVRFRRRSFNMCDDEFGVSILDDTAHISWHHEPEEYVLDFYYWDGTGWVAAVDEAPRPSVPRADLDEHVAAAWAALPALKQKVGRKP